MSDLVKFTLQVLQRIRVKLCRTDMAGKEGCSQPSAMEDRQLRKATPASGSHRTFICPLQLQGELHNEAMIQAEHLSLVLIIK